MAIELDVIAVVRSCFDGKFGIPRQPGLCRSAWGELVFEPEYRSREAVRGLEEFSHVWLLFQFHHTAGQGWKPTVRPPRLGGNRRVGVFASRSTYRPNGLGMSVVRLLGVDFEREDGPVLRLGGVDLADGTPVVDVKPYLPYADAVEGATGGYAAEVPAGWEVVVDDGAREAFGRLPEADRSLVIEALSYDPRPAVHGDDPERVYGMGLCGRNVRFRVVGGVCRIVAIGPG